MYFHDIYRFLLFLCHNHHTAEDHVQETFFRAYLHIESYKKGNIKTWLFTVAHNAFIDYHRKHKRTTVKEQNFFTSLFDTRKTTEETVGAVITGPTKEVLKLQDEDLVENLEVDEVAFWNWE